MQYIDFKFNTGEQILNVTVGYTYEGAVNSDPIHAECREDLEGYFIIEEVEVTDQDGNILKDSSIISDLEIQRELELQQNDQSLDLEGLFVFDSFDDSYDDSLDFYA